MKALSWMALSTIFVSGVYVETKYGVFFFYYVLMLASYVLAVMRTGSLGIRKEYAVFLFFLMAISIIGYIVSSVVYGTDFSRFASIILKSGMLAFFLLFFASIFNLCHKSVEVLFYRYLDVALVFASLGVLQEVVFFLLRYDIFSSIGGGAKDFGSYLGVAGLSVEPAFYACSLLPAGAYVVARFFSTFKLSLSGIVIVLAIIFSTSSLGYLGLFISAMITVCLGIKLRHVWMIFILVPLLGVGVYKVSQLDFFKMRMDDTVAVLQGAELTMSTGMNISTYALAVNMSMAMRSLEDSYGLGVGFGNYSYVFDHYIDNYEMPTYRDNLPGRGSATSLFARLTAEVGVVAWLFFIAVLFWGWREIRRGIHPAICTAYVATLMIILLRMGEYYTNGVVLVFLMIYWLRLESQGNSKDLTVNKV